MTRLEWHYRLLRILPTRVLDRFNRWLMSRFRENRRLGRHGRKVVCAFLCTHLTRFLTPYRGAQRLPDDMIHMEDMRARFDFLNTYYPDRDYDDESHILGSYWRMMKKLGN